MLFRMLIAVSALAALIAVSGTSVESARHEDVLESPRSLSTVDQSQPAAPGFCFYPLVMGDVWGRATVEPNPENDIDSLDALYILRKSAGQFLPKGPPCSPMDIDCDGDVDAIDALWILRWAAGLPYHQEEGCIPIGTPFGAYS